MDISKLTTKELQTLLKRIPKEINGRKQQEKAKLLDDIAKIASKSGYSLKELMAKTPRSVKPKKSGKRKPVAVKYRHPQQADLAWTGRGRKPHWVTKWLGEGKHHGESGGLIQGRRLPMSCSAWRLSIQNAGHRIIANKNQYPCTGAARKYCCASALI